MTEQSEHFEKALKAFGCTCGPDFEQRYETDPWVFHLANAIDVLTYRVEELEAELRGKE